MTEAVEGQEINPIERFVLDAKEELEQVRRESKEIGLLVEQSQGEVEKLAQRNATITAHIHQIQSNFDTIPREDIRSTYEAAQDAQQRLFTMRGQLEKLESDQANLQRLADFMEGAINLLEGRSMDEVPESENAANTSVEQLIEAQEEERRKISRQIHDGPAQSLSNFILQAEIALRLFDSDPEKAREELNDLKAAAGTTFSHVRDFIFDLRPMMLDDLGLVPTVRRYAEAYKEKTGLDLSVVVTGNERRLETHQEVLIFRTIQMALGNVRDHAQATQVRVMVDMGDNLVRAAVEDNGKGFDAEAAMSDEPGHLGLKMAERRVMQLGGEFELESQAGEGTRVSFTIPIEN